MSYFPEPSLSTDEPAPQRPKRHWRAKFGDAFRGLKFGVRGHSSFFAHFFFAALVVAAAVILRCSLEQWCLLLACIGMVLTAELFNSAIETLFRGLDEATKDKTWHALDISAGAVLMISLIAAVIGAAVLLSRLVDLLE